MHARRGGKERARFDSRKARWVPIGHRTPQQQPLTTDTPPQEGPTFVCAVVAAADEDAIKALRQAVKGWQFVIVALQG